MVYSKYSISFTTYDEFLDIYDSIPEEDRMEWAENLSPKLLRVENWRCWTVAHELANNGFFPKKWVLSPARGMIDNLLWREDNDDWTVAHVLVRNGTFLEAFLSSSDRKVIEELLLTKNSSGWTVAHELAYKGTFPEKWVTEKLLRLKDKWGTTVAHGLAHSGILPKMFLSSPIRGGTEKLLRMKNWNGTTVAHELARSGTLPEKFLTEEFLLIKDDNDMTIAGCLYDFLSENCRWDLLTPIVLGISYINRITLRISIMDKVIQDLSKMSNQDLDTALSIMPEKTRLKLLSDIKNPDLFERIRKCLDKESESEIFENQQRAIDTPTNGGGQDIHFEEREDLYESGRKM